MRWKVESGDWTRYRRLTGASEVDFHWGERERKSQSYQESMNAVRQEALDALKSAQENGTTYIILTHGWSTSRRGTTTARSVIRSLMHSPAATPYIIRPECIQHDSVFVAAIRSLKTKHLNQ